MPTTPRPILTIQTSSLYASADDSTFTGTGGPAAFSPYTGQFADLVSSQGIAGEPFDDEVYDVDAGDQVTFVIAIQNFGSVAGYDIKLRDTLPLGFAYAGSDLTVVDGAGNTLRYGGNLFDPMSGLTIVSPVAAYSDDGGTNVVLVTFTATATNAVVLPGATVSNTAQIVSYAASHGGTNLAPSATASLTASTPVQTGPLLIESTPDQPAATLQSNQTASFDITVTLPEGTVTDLRIDEILPQIGSSWLQLVSTEIVSIGSHLTTSGPATVQPGGSVQLGTVVNAADNLVTADDTVVLRVTVAGGGTTAGQGTINTTVSAADPYNNGARISQTVSNTLTLGPVDHPPTIAGVSGAQSATNTVFVLPFQTLTLADPDADQVETLTVHLADPTLGTLSGPSGLTIDAAGDYVLTGPVATLQATARALLFTPSANASGTEIFGLTLDDGAGATASASAGLTLAAPAIPSTYSSFPISTQTVLTSTATGSSTYSLVQNYAGAVDNLTTQFINDGAATLAIVAQQTGMLINTTAADATAVQLLGGVNVLDMQHGSSFLVSGTGNDTILLHADQAVTTWNTVANFHAGDTIIVYGVDADISTRAWDPNAGAIGYTGATLRFDVDGNGSIDSSLTFAGKSLGDTAAFKLQSGTVGGAGFLSITTS